MATQKYPEAQSPLILRAQRLIEAFAKSNDERDFYLDRVEGFIIFVDLDKPQESVEVLEKELEKGGDRYCIIPKLSFYETKKIMEGFVHEKVYDIDTKEKLLDIIQSKEARENFLEFIYDIPTELEKWQQFYQERSRIRIIEWLRNNHFHFVFEEDLDLGSGVIEKLKEQQFTARVPKELASARKILVNKAKTYYSNEALNPRPKRGRPPKQAAKQEVDTQVSADIYTQVPPMVRQFLFTPDISSVSAATFSEKYESEAEMFESLGSGSRKEEKDEIVDLNKKLASLRNLSNKWVKEEPAEGKKKTAASPRKKPIRVKDSKAKEEPKPSSKKKPLRNIIKKKESPKKSSSTKKKGEKKRIIPKSPAPKPKKKPLRKIIKKKDKS